MITIAQVFKMFPQTKVSPRYNSLAKKKSKPKDFKALFSEGIKDGCNAFAKEMGFKTNKLKKHENNLA